MDRKNQNSVPYTAGSLEYPTPRVVSMLKHSPYAGRAEGVNLKQDIVSTLNFINNERSYWQKMNLASMKLAKSMSQATVDDVAKLNHRWQEVSVLCQIQRVKRESLKYNTELQRTFQHGTVDNQNIKRKIVRPEHFERGTPHTLKATAKAPMSKNKANLVNRDKGITSPWEGSQFKFELLLSLRAKLLKKLVLSALRCYKQTQHNNRQCIATCVRSKLKRLVQLCFGALLLEALSAKYIVFAGNFTARKLLVSKYLRPSLCTLQRYMQKQQHNAALFARSAALYRRAMRRRGYRLLHWHRQYMQHSRVCVKWSVQHAGQQCVLKAFSAWIGSFVEKNRLRQQIYTRYSQSTSNGTSQVDSSSVVGDLSRLQLHATPNNRSSNKKHHSATSATPLQRVLEQSSLQNLRTAVSFFVEQHTASHTPHSGIHRSHHTSRHNDTYNSRINSTTNKHNTSSSTSKSGKFDDISSPSEEENGDENDDVNDTDVPFSCQKGLQLHSKQSLSALKSSLHTLRYAHNNAMLCSSDSGDDLNVSRHHHTNRNTTTKPTTTSINNLTTPPPLLHPNMRELFRSCIQAKRAFPQARFNNAAFHSSSSGSSNRCNSDNSNINIDGTYSGDSPSGTLSRKWRHRHTGDSSYIRSLHSDDDEQDSDREYNNIEDLLLNTTTNTAHTTRSRSCHTHDTSNKSALNDSRVSTSSSNLQAGGLMDRAIHESFVLSPSKHASYSNTINTSNTDIINSNTPYFTHPTSTGTFCGQVEVDSDLETAISASDPSTPNSRASRRLMVHRKFVAQIQGAFQMIKFRWLIQQCRRFVRTLHRTARLHRQAHHCRRLHARHSRALSLQRWRRVYAKHATASDLCARINDTKLCRRLLRAWFDVSIRRLVPAYTHTFRLCRATAQRRSMNVWRAAFVQRLYQHTIDRGMARSKKVRILAHWRVYVGMVKRSRYIHSVMAKKVLNPVFQQWRSKYKQRLLLSRVFTLHDAAWDHRTYTTPSPFQRLYAVLNAWKSYTGKRLRVRREESNRRKCLYFRGVSLLARHFHCWVDFATTCKEEKRECAERRTELKSRYFALWTQRARQQRRQIVLLRRRLLEQSPLRRILHFWHHYTSVRCKYAPRLHHHSTLLRKSFEHIKTMRPLRRMEENNMELRHTSRLRISLRAWKGLLARTERYRKGFFILNRAFLKLKMKLAYFFWPGRRQSLLARQMSEYLRVKHRDRIRLVDCAVEEEKNPEVTSFVAKRRPTLAQRAAKRGYIDHIADVKGLHYYKTLCTTLLQLWSIAAKTDVSLRYRAFQVKHALQKRALRQCTMHWVLVTPRTAYRRVVWMVRGAPKPHDDYTHKKQQDRVFDTASKLRRKGETKSTKSTTSNTSVGLLTSSSPTNGDGEDDEKYAGEYYIDSDDSDVDSTLLHHVVWA